MLLATRMLQASRWFFRKTIYHSWRLSRGTGQLFSHELIAQQSHHMISHSFAWSSKELLERWANSPGTTKHPKRNASRSSMGVFTAPALWSTWSTTCLILQSKSRRPSPYSSSSATFWTSQDSALTPLSSWPTRRRSTQRWLSRHSRSLYSRIFTATARDSSRYSWTFCPMQLSLPMSVAKSQFRSRARRSWRPRSKTATWLFPMLPPQAMIG